MINEETLRKKMRDIHKTAAAINEAEEKEKQAELREKLKAQREAITPLTDEEIKAKENSKGKSMEEIIESGTPEEIAALVISDTDRNRAYGTPKKIREAENKRLKANLNKRPQEERSVFLFYIKEYDRMTLYYQRLYTSSKKFQVEATLLMNLITKWEDYDREAENCTRLYRAFQDTNLLETSDGRTILTYEAEMYETLYLERILDSHSNWDKATLIYDSTTRTFKADIDGEGKLYEDILAQVEDTKIQLSKFKAMVEVAEEYISEEVASFVEPIKMKNTIENTKEEIYLKGLDGRLRYFRSELNERKKRGETITPEDEKRAVYPNYYEVEADENTKRNAREILYKIK